MVDHLFVFEGEGVVRDFPGNYTEYRDKKEQEEKKIGKDAKASQQQTTAKSPSIDAAPVSYAADATSKTATQKKKLSFKEKFEFDELEKDIAKLEAQKAKITEDLNASTDNHDDIVKWTGQIGNIMTQLDEKSLRWLELSEGV
ncbi:MAG: hypothetical protein V4547_07930 [Bacteroidota bacterium]